MRRGKERSKNSTKIVIIVIIAILAIVGGAYYFLSKNNDKELAQNEVSSINLETKNEQSESPKKEEPKKPEIKIFSGDDRPKAFMIDNNKNAQPQSSINSAYIVYEIIVEGGETRLMALFKGVTADEVGPIRSARHYFLDYAMENDAIYAHLGLSPQADEGMKNFKINNINGQVYDTGKARTDTSLYWREKSRKAPHNAYTNTGSIMKIAKDKGYKTTSNKESVLNYVEKEVNLTSDDALVANAIKIPYSKGHNVEYKYNEKTKRYTRYSKGRKITDKIAKEDTTTKNIIITFAENYTLDDGENKGRQDVVTVGELNGYYITNGKAIKIKCVKKSRSEQTIYQDLNGNEIEVNDGNTWINICPIDANVTISE